MQRPQVVRKFGALKDQEDAQGDWANRARGCFERRQKGFMKHLENPGAPVQHSWPASCSTPSSIGPMLNH